MSAVHGLLPGSLSLLVFLGAPALSSDHEETFRIPGTRCSLALRVNAGQDFVFHAIDEAGKRKVDYRVVVQSVAEKGDITLALVGFRLRTEKEPPLAQAEAHGTTFTLSGEGRVKRINEKLTVPPEFETHLRFVFGSGIHARPLEEKHVYRLAPLLAAAELEPIHLRFEGLVVEEDEELARFIVVEGPGVAPEPRHAEPDAPRALRVVATAEATSSTTPGFTTPERASIRASGQEWTAVGEATYRTADGVLEAARLEGRSTDRAPNEPELAKLSIRRIFIGRVGKTSSGSEGPLGIR